MTRSYRTARQSLWHIFFWPCVINVIALIGLISALIGNDMYDLTSWICLGGSVVFMVYAYATGPKNTIRQRHNDI